jgi:hypothetical protein
VLVQQQLLISQGGGGSSSGSGILTSLARTAASAAASASCCCCCCCSCSCWAGLHGADAGSSRSSGKVVQLPALRVVHTEPAQPRSRNKRTNEDTQATTKQSPPPSQRYILQQNVSAIDRLSKHCLLIIREATTAEEVSSCSRQQADHRRPMQCMMLLLYRFLQ